MKHQNHSNIFKNYLQIPEDASIYKISKVASPICSGELSSTEFMARISDQTRAIQAGVRSLRAEMDSQMRLLDIGQEAVVLSGLSKHASSSLKNIKNLYDETKYLKTYLEKVLIKERLISVAGSMIFL